MTISTARYPLVRDPRLGRHWAFDSRNLHYLSTREATYVDAKWPRHIPIYDQGQTGACTGNAIGGACATGPLWDALTKALQQAMIDRGENLADEFYGEATALDSFPGTYNWKNPTEPGSEDTGSDGTSACKAAKNDGYISGYLHALSLSTALGALEKQPVISGMNWYESMFTPNSKGVIVISPGSGVAGGHELCFDEIVVEEQLVGFQQSWGDWGVDGRGYMSWDTWARLLSENGDVNVPAPLATTPPTPTPSPAVDADVLGAYQALTRWAARNGVQ